MCRSRAFPSPSTSKQHNAAAKLQFLSHKSSTGTTATATPLPFLVSLLLAPSSLSTMNTVTSSSTASLLPIVPFPPLRYENGQEGCGKLVASLQDSATACLATLMRDDVLLSSNLVDLDKILFDDGFVMPSSQDASVATVAAANVVYPLSSSAPAQTAAHRMPALPQGLATSALSFYPPVAAPAMAVASRNTAIATQQQQHTGHVSPSPSQGSLDCDTNSKKRKRTVIRMSSSTKKKKTVVSLDLPSNLSPEEEEEVKRQRNCLHAKASRQRKKIFQNELQVSLQILQEENQKLRNYLTKKSSLASNSIETSVAKELAKPTERFLQHLKQNPKTRRVNARTLRFLKGLRKNVQLGTGR